MSSRANRHYVRRRLAFGHWQCRTGHDARARSYTSTARSWLHAMYRKPGGACCKGGPARSRPGGSAAAAPHKTAAAPPTLHALLAPLPAAAASTPSLTTRPPCLPFCAAAAAGKCVENPDGLDDLTLGPCQTCSADGTKCAVCWNSFGLTPAGECVQVGASSGGVLCAAPGCVPAVLRPFEIMRWGRRKILLPVPLDWGPSPGQSTGLAPSPLDWWGDWADAGWPTYAFAPPEWFKPSVM